MAGLNRASRFGAVADYATRARDEICLILQVESVEALGNLDAILAVEGVDAVFVGPADLAASMGHPGNPSHPDVVSASLDAIRRIRAAGKPAGFLTLDAAVLEQAIEAGSLFTAVDIDAALLRRGAMEAAARWRDR
jgi:4-hydroxy-2-oxoheptanedioate aldolase